MSEATNKYQEGAGCTRLSTSDCALNTKQTRCRSVIEGQGDGHCICSEQGICVKTTTVQGLRAKLQKMERQLLQSRELHRLSREKPRSKELLRGTTKRKVKID